MAAEDGVALQVCLLTPGEKLAILRRILVPWVGVRCHQLSPHLAGERLLRCHGHLGCPPAGLRPPGVITIRPWKQHGRHPRNAAEDGARPFDIVMEGETPGDDWEQAIATGRPPHRGGPHLVPETHVRQSVVRPWLAGDAHMHHAGATSYRLYQCQG